MSIGKQLLQIHILLKAAGKFRKSAQNRIAGGSHASRKRLEINL